MSGGFGSVGFIKLNVGEEGTRNYARPIQSDETLGVHDGEGPGGECSYADGPTGDLTMALSATALEGECVSDNLLGSDLGYGNNKRAEKKKKRKESLEAFLCNYPKVELASGWLRPNFSA